MTLTDRARIVFVCATFGVALLFGLRGCFGYSEVSPKTYEFAKALLQTSQRRDDPKIPKSRADAVNDIEEQIQVAVQANELKSDEAEILSKIIALTREEDWDAAKTKLRSLLEAQVQ